jgi:histidinol dehydrogenase
MPTGGTARFASPLSVDDFVKIISVVGLSAQRLGQIGATAARLARAEGFEAHARAVEARAPTPAAEGAGLADS